MADRFGINSFEWGQGGGEVELFQGKDAYKHYKAAGKNPELYTTTRPNGGAKAVFTLPDTSSGGIDDNNWDEDIYFYKIPQPKAAAPAPAPKPAPAPPPPPKPQPKPVPTKLSKEAATAIGRAAAYEDTVRPQYGDYLIGGDESVIDDFEKSADEKIEEASKLYFDDDVNRDEAQEYADKYKLKLGDDLRLTPIV